MNFLTSLHGTVAAVLICSLLFADEAGLPLPIAPSEVLLLLTGVLISSGAFPIWVIVPAAFLSMTAGMIAGYAWARALGESGLQSLAARVHAEDVYERARRRLKATNAWGIAVCRLVPGLRPYATLVSGAAGVEIRTFLLGAIPALLIWEVVLILAGMIVGLPLAHLLGRFERLALRGAVLVALGAVAWFAIRNASADERAGIARVAPRLRPTLALLVDAGIVLCVVGGLFAIGGRVLEVTADGWIELLAAALMLLVLLLIGRNKQTPGETLFETNYWHHHVPAASR